MTSGLVSAVFPHGLQRWGLRLRQRPHRAGGRNRNYTWKTYEDIWNVHPEPDSTPGKGVGGLAGRRGCVHLGQ